jgi:hypothetical protein
MHICVILTTTPSTTTAPQFNFGDRAAQTFNFPLKDRATMTEPPPTATVSGGWAGVCGWVGVCERAGLRRGESDHLTGHFQRPTKPVWTALFLFSPQTHHRLLLRLGSL